MSHPEKPGKPRSRMVVSHQSSSSSDEEYQPDSQRGVKKGTKKSAKKKPVSGSAKSRAASKIAKKSSSQSNKKRQKLSKPVKPAKTAKLQKLPPGSQLEEERVIQSQPPTVIIPKTGSHSPANTIWLSGLSPTRSPRSQPEVLTPHRISPLLDNFPAYQHNPSLSKHAAAAFSNRIRPSDVQPVFSTDNSDTDSDYERHYPKAVNKLIPTNRKNSAKRSRERHSNPNSVWMTFVVSVLGCCLCSRVCVECVCVRCLLEWSLRVERWSDKR